MRERPIVAELMVLANPALEIEEEALPLPFDEDGNLW